MTAILSLLSLAKPMLSAAWAALQKPAVLIALAIVLLLAALWFEDHARGAAVSRQKAAETALAAAKASAVVEARQAAVSEAAASTDATAQARILTVYKSLSMEIPHVLPAAADAQCVVPSGVVGLLDAGVSGLPFPGPAGGADAAAPAVDAHLSDLVADALANDQAKRSNDRQLIDLQAWVRGQQAVQP